NNIAIYNGSALINKIDIQYNSMHERYCFLVALGRRRDEKDYLPSDTSAVQHTRIFMEVMSNKRDSK
ncbi:hypothetical protein DVA81_19865, partial [Acinetobacter baumannii]